MNLLLGGLLWTAVTAMQAPKSTSAPPQTPASKPAAPANQEPRTEPTRVGAVQFDANGWPIVQDVQSHQPAPAPAFETARVVETKTPVTSPGERPQALAVPADAGGLRQATQRLASGMESGSPLLEVFQSVRAPGTWKALGGLQVWWRITILDQQGGIIGYRELTQTVDTAFAERDRLEYPEDGRVYGRSGAAVFAERQGRPWPTGTDSAAQELMLFGLQMRLPWCLGDAVSFAVVHRDMVNRPDDRLQRIYLERRPAAGSDVMGPELEPKPRDRFELLYEPSSGRPREFVHCLANSGQSRRVLLDDWQEFQGVPYAKRRTYVDDQLRPTTILEIQRLEAVTVTDRDFRMR